MPVVLIKASSERALEMTCGHDQQPIQTLGSDSPNEPFRDAIRVRYLNGRPNNSDALGLEHRVEAAATRAIVIANQETNGVCALTERPRNLLRLLRHPLIVRM
jgi:hypothetical protein